MQKPVKLLCSLCPTEFTRLTAALLLTFYTCRKYFPIDFCCVFFFFSWWSLLTLFTPHLLISPHHDANSSLFKPNALWMKCLEICFMLSQDKLWCLLWSLVTASPLESRFRPVSILSLFTDHSCSYHSYILYLNPLRNKTQHVTQAEPQPAWVPVLQSDIFDCFERWFLNATVRHKARCDWLGTFCTGWNDVHHQRESSGTVTADSSVGLAFLNRIFYDEPLS